MLRIAKVVLSAMTLSAASAMRVPTEQLSRRALIGQQTGIFSVASAMVFLSEPVHARSAAEMQLKSVPGETATDLKDMLSGFETKLEEDKRTALEKKLEEEKSLPEKLKDSITADKKAPPKDRPKPGTAVPRVKKEKPSRAIGDGLYGL